MLEVEIIQTETIQPHTVVVNFSAKKSSGESFQGLLKDNLELKLDGETKIDHHCMN